MASEFKPKFSLIGHAERSSNLRESAEIVGTKALRCIEVEITSMVCAGETLTEPLFGETSQVVKHQLTAAVDSVTIGQALRLVIAYARVWVTGTGRSESTRGSRLLSASS